MDPYSSLTIDGVDMGEAFGAFLTDATELLAPEPKTHFVDVPGGQSLDLTEALGGVAYENREMTLVLAVPGTGDWEAAKSRMLALVHGRRLPFSLGCDPGYTYTGRFTVSECRLAGLHGSGDGLVTLKVSADPYKLREHVAYRLNATGGRLYRLMSGLRPVHPTIEVATATTVTWDGAEIDVPPGTWRLNDVTFRPGANELYVNTQRIWATSWADLGEGGRLATAWAGAASHRWDDVQRLGVVDGAPRCWEDVASSRWSDLGQGGDGARRWDELDFRNGSAVDTTAFITYDWEDL